MHDLEPWYFVDDKASLCLPPDFSENQFACKEFRLETGIDFDVYLFARRQDMDDFAFFLVENGCIKDRVYSAHLSFSKRLEFKKPLKKQSFDLSFMQWVSQVVIPDVADWMSEEDIEVG